MAGSKFTLEIDVPGFNEARRGAKLQNRLHSIGVTIANAAGGEPDFVVIDAPSTTRARVVVVTATAKAKRAEAVDRALSNAFSANLS